MILTLIHFNMLFYSHVNEDNTIERQLLQNSGCRHAVAIAGSGERVIALLDQECCNKITVVDSNKEAMFLLQLKIAALCSLSVEEYLQFIGHYEASKQFRLTCYKLIRQKLTEEGVGYWDTQKLIIEKGILYAGHFEKFLSSIRPVINLFLGKAFQNIFHSAVTDSFPSLRWKMISSLFGKKWIYKVWGNKDTAFTGKGSSVGYIPMALNKVIRNGKAGSCFMMHLIFKGHLRHMSENDLPPSLQKSVLEKIRKKICTNELTIDYCVNDLFQFISQQIHLAEPTFYSLSDILSFEDHDYLNALLGHLNLGENVIVARSFLRNRLSTQQLKNLLPQYGTIEVHDDKESTSMYQVVSIRCKKPLREGTQSKQTTIHAC